MSLNKRAPWQSQQNNGTEKFSMRLIRRKRKNSISTKPFVRTTRNDRTSIRASNNMAAAITTITHTEKNTLRVSCTTNTVCTSMLIRI